jgi:outer membrane receptor protein involved in Fe transport
MLTSSARSLLAFAGVIVLVLHGSEVAAQEPETDIEDVQLDALLERDLGQQLGTTTAVSRKREDVIAAPASVSTLHWDQIRHSGARTVPDLLRWVPGVQVARAAPGNYNVSLRGTAGLNGNNVVVTINGIPINSPVDASVDWDLIPIHVADIERIEIVRGPVSTIYGQNAYTGVINIVTREPYGRSTSLAARGEVGADLKAGMLGAVSGRYGTNGQAASASVLAAGEIDATGRAARTRDAPTLRRGGTMAHLGLQTGEKSQLSFDLGASASDRSSLDHLVLESIPQTRALVLGSIRFGAQAISSWIDNAEIWARNTAQFTQTDASLYEGFSYADTKSNRAALGADVGLSLASKLQLTLGGELDLDWIDAPYVNASANDRVYSGYGAYSTLTYSPFERVHLTVGGRGDVPTAIATFKLSYRFGIVYAADDWSLRLAAASAYRTPSYVELGGSFVDPASGLILLEGDPDLRAPTNETIELGLIAAPLATVRVSPTVYVSRLSDVIVEDFAPFVRRTFTNDPSPRFLLGIELEADWQLRDDLGIALNVGTVHWLDVDESITPTIGVPKQGSAVIVGARLHGSLLHERFGYGVGANYATERVFALRAGVPPSIIDTNVAARTHAFVMAEYFLGFSLPLWVSLRVFATLPDAEVESPLPAAAASSSSAVLGVDYRGD